MMMMMMMMMNFIVCMNSQNRTETVDCCVSDICDLTSWMHSQPGLPWSFWQLLHHQETIVCSATYVATILLEFMCPYNRQICQCSTATRGCQVRVFHYLLICFLKILYPPLLLNIYGWFQSYFFVVYLSVEHHSVWLYRNLLLMFWNCTYMNVM